MNRKRIWLALLAGLVLTACGINPAMFRGRTLLQDDFAVPGAYPWEVGADDAGSAAISAEQLVIALNEAESLQFVPLAEPEVEDFSLEVDVTLLQGALNSSYGILFRMQSNQAFYRFDITGDGYYIVEKRLANGEWERLSLGWTESEAIKVGANATNRLGVAVREGRLAVFVNGRLLGRYDLGEDRYGSGRVALDVGTFQQGGLQVAFDNLILREQ